VDWGSLIGIVLALGGMLAGQMLEGGKLGSLMQPAAFVIVFVGTLGAVLLQSGWQQFFARRKDGGAAFSVRKQDDYARPDAATFPLERRLRAVKDLLSLERVIKDVEDQLHLHTVCA
jgi:chemotaxis protein MotA